MNRSRKQSGIIFAGIIFAFVVIAAIILGVVMKSASTAAENEAKGKTLEQLLQRVSYTTAEPVKGAIEFSDGNLYDELPEITKYPIAVQGRGQVDIEIFTSGEKAGANQDSWLIDMAEAFNRQNNTTASGKTISLTVRSVGSGLAADYILSGKYLPDLYTPSNQLFGDYAIANGADMELYLERLVGNTAGILVKKNLNYNSVDDVLNAVMNSQLNLGYTNPQNSATGINLLIYLLQSNGGVDSQQAHDALSKFNNNIPFVAYTTQQMTVSAANGSLDAIVSEYQAYTNDSNLKDLYNFIPFGVRHDNPVYLVNPNSKSVDEKEAISQILEYLTGSQAQSAAKNKGFNYNDDYKSSYTTYGAETGRALQVYKRAKDSGKDIIAMFVADCSGSMNGAAILQLKESLSNGIQYINENNYIGLISYSTTVTLELPLAPFDLNQKSYFQGAINGLQASGNTSTYEALCVAMDLVLKAKESNPNAKCMIFLLSDGQANGSYRLRDIQAALQDTTIPVYTIAYTDSADTNELQALSNINEAAAIKADSDDIVYQIKSLFNSQL